MEEKAGVGVGAWAEPYLKVKLQMEAACCARLTAAAFAEAFMDGWHGVKLSFYEKQGSKLVFQCLRCFSS